MNEAPADMRLRVRCCSCDRTAEIPLPPNRETLEGGLASQPLRLARVARRSDERDKVSLLEFLCGHCEEAEMRYPP